MLRSTCAKIEIAAHLIQQKLFQISTFQLKYNDKLGK